MKVIGFVGNDTIKNRFIRIDYDKSENVMNKLDLTCRTCGAQIKVYLDGKTRNGSKVKCLYNHDSKSFSRNAKIFDGRYFCGNCGRSSAWKNADSMDLDTLTQAIILQSLKNKKYRENAAKVKTEEAEVKTEEAEVKETENKREQIYNEMFDNNERGILVSVAHYIKHRIARAIRQVKRGDNK